MTPEDVVRFVSNLGSPGMEVRAQVSISVITGRLVRTGRSFACCWRSTRSATKWVAAISASALVVIKVRMVILASLVSAASAVNLLSWQEQAVIIDRKTQVTNEAQDRGFSPFRYR